jgi:hypothetical protein
MKSLKALFVLALAVAFAVPAYAETQNVKVSGAIDAYWFYRHNYDLKTGNDIGITTPGTATASYNGGGGPAVLNDYRSNTADFFRSNTQIEVSADLTDNVSTVINIVNQRDWNAHAWTPAPAGVTGATPNNTANEFDVNLDLAYVQMKEIFYSPLTLTVGRQDLWFGRGFIIGNNNTAWDSQGTTVADEYSVTTAFDAVRATLDFNPWTIDLVYSQIYQNSVNSYDNKDLYIANVNYKFAEYNAVAEGYYVGELDRATLSTNVTFSSGGNDTHTVGGRVQFDPISQITLGGELAYQFGNYRAVATAPDRDRSAWAADVFGTYRWDYTWKPEVTVEYVLFSGEEDLSNTTAEYGSWNMLYRGHFWTAYADFRELTFGTSDAVDQNGATNVQFLQVKAGMKPLEDLLLEASFTYLWNDADVHSVPGVQSSSVRDKEIGWEIDTQATYDYTEDVTFGVLAGWFVPGSFYAGGNDKTATDIVSSVKVSF